MLAERVCNGRNKEKPPVQRKSSCTGGMMYDLET